jgi:hypothetical protein
MLIYFFQDSLTGSALSWYMRLDFEYAWSLKYKSDSRIRKIVKQEEHQSSLQNPW